MNCDISSIQLSCILLHDSSNMSHANSDLDNKCMFTFKTKPIKLYNITMVLEETIYMYVVMISNDWLLPA